MAGILRSVSAVRIFTRDLDRARLFYGGILDLEQSAEGPGYVVFDLAGVDIVVESVALDDPDGSDLVGRFIAASFGVDDVESTYRHLTARGVSFLQPPETQHWGGRLAFALDPDDNVITLIG